jgi:cytochrome P450
MPQGHRLADLDDPTFDPFTDEVAWGDIDDPYPIIAEHRAKAAVQPIEYRKLFTDVPDQALSHHATYSVFRYDEIAEVLADPVRFSNAIFRESFGMAFGETISVMDPPVHTSHRRILQKAFLPQVVRQWTDEIIDPTIRRLLRPIAGRGKAELVSEFVSRFPFEIIYGQLDIPSEDGPVLHKLAFAQVFWSTYPDIVREAGRKLGDFFGPLVRERRKTPGPDFISVMATAEVDGAYLPEEVAVSFLRQLMNGSGDTTHRATGTLLMALLNHPDQLEMLRGDRSLIPAAVDEALRWDGPVTTNWRLVTEDTRLGGVEIPKGSVLNLVLQSANHDERKYDDPERFDIRRPKGAPNLAFGVGPHICIGRHLARIEMERALNAVLDLLPNLRPDPDYPAPHSRGIHLRTPASLHVLFD